LIWDRVRDFVRRHHVALQKAIDYRRDFNFDYFPVQVLIHNKYLIRHQDHHRNYERIQHLWMRVSCHIYAQSDDIESCIQSYHYMSQKLMIHATPSLQNAGLERAQFASCFLLTMQHDSIDGIYDTLKQCAQISKHAGGIALSINNIRAVKSLIRSTYGQSNGVVPMLSVYDATAKYVDQGGGKRKGSIAIYMEPWHIDIEDFIDIKKNEPPEDRRCRNLLTALWVPDLFFERAIANQEWTLFCPDFVSRTKYSDGRPAVALQDLWGEKFEERYRDLEAQIAIMEKSIHHRNRPYKKINAHDLMIRIIVSCLETGLPYILAKDSCNRKSNQQHLGTIHSSNLCTEIIEYSSKDEVAVCNLASLNIRAFVPKRPRVSVKMRNMIKEERQRSNKTIQLPPELKQAWASHGWEIGTPIKVYEILEKEFPRVILMSILEFCDPLARIDWLQMGQVVQFMVKSLNRVIDTTYYPVKEAQHSNLLHRPIGIGVQALADAFCCMRFPWNSDLAKGMNERLFEWIYFNALTASCREAAEKGVYSSYAGSPVSKGILQMDMWEKDASNKDHTSPFCDWKTLRANIKRHGLRNSLLVAPMPTATTSQILGNSESFSPLNSNIFRRRTQSGEYTISNPHLVDDLIDLALWNAEMREAIVLNDGSLILPKDWQSLDESESLAPIAEFPTEIVDLYKTLWEIPLNCLLQMMIDRGRFIDQSQSFSPPYRSDLKGGGDLIARARQYILTAWKMGAKTISYYSYNKQTAKSNKFTINTSKKKKPVVSAVSAAAAAASPSPVSPLTPLTAPILLLPTTAETRKTLSFSEEEEQGKLEDMMANIVDDADNQPCVACSS
jgi:ribonucleoside-diphosphate reductase subunit M1